MRRQNNPENRALPLYLDRFNGQNPLKLIVLNCIFRILPEKIFVELTVNSVEISQHSQDYFLPVYNQEAAPRWQAVAKWAAGISLAVFGMGLAVYAYRCNGFVFGLPDGDKYPEGADGELTNFEHLTSNQIPSLDLSLNRTVPCEKGGLMQMSCLDLSLNGTGSCEEGELIQIHSLDLGLNGTLPCENSELVQTSLVDLGLNSTGFCEEGEPAQEWLVCEKASELDGLQECEVFKNVCISSAEQPRSFLRSAGSVALKCAAQAGSKVCSSTVNAGKAALRTFCSVSYQTGKICMKGLLAAKVSHHTLGTGDPNPPLIMALGRTPLRCLTHDLAPLLRHHGLPLC